MAAPGPGAARPVQAGSPEPTIRIGQTDTGVVGQSAIRVAEARTVRVVAAFDAFVAAANFQKAAIVGVAASVVTFVRDAVAVAISARTAGDIATVGNTIGLAVGFALIRNLVSGAILAGPTTDVALVRDGVGVAILAKPAG